MILPAVLFYPAARVWNLRFLLLWTLAIIVLWVVALAGEISRDKALGITALCLIFLHHILAVVPWKLRGLALIDLGWTLLEIIEIAYITSRLPDGAGIFFCPPLASLTFSMLCRIATIKKSTDSIRRQRFAFLGGCAETHPPYTPPAILLNRSIARPLVRGESRFIIFPRAVILSLIALGVPAFAIYSILITPGSAQIYTRSIDSFRGLDVPPGNATISLRILKDGEFTDTALYASEVYATNRKGGINCERTPIMTIFECPQKWAETVEISISLSIPVGARLYVAPVQGSLIPPSPEVAQLARDYAWSTGVPLLSGSQLYGLFTWTRRDLMRARTWSISPTPLTTVFTPEITGLQTIYPANESRPNAATLTLFQQETYATRLLQDTVDTTALTGIATFGGFWTFLNGAFALFFGANVLYFLFGRRPLSALGVVHVFQRRRLVRRWHEDFPAIHTEGGLPGSKSAGIVAFIRERLVDLGEDPHAPTDSDHPDIEAQTPPKGEGLDEEEDVPIPLRSHETQTYSKFTPPKLGYRLDEIPFLDVDLGMDKILDNNKISDRSMG